MRKIRVKEKIVDESTINEAILSIHAAKTKLDCAEIKWTDHSDLDVTEPAGNIVAIVVDLRQSTSQVRIYDVNDDQVDMVGKKYKGSLVILEWKPHLNYVCYGECRVGQIQEKDEKKGEHPT
jgi:hypothetical protein